MNDELYWELEQVNQKLRKQGKYVIAIDDYGKQWFKLYQINPNTKVDVVLKASNQLKDLV